MECITGVLEHFKFSPADARTCREMADMIKQYCPGEYEVVCSVDKDRRVMINMTFADPEDAVVFKLKYW